MKLKWTKKPLSYIYNYFFFFFSLKKCIFFFYKKCIFLLFRHFQKYWFHFSFSDIYFVLLLFYDHKLCFLFCDREIKAWFFFVLFQCSCHLFFRSREQVLCQLSHVFVTKSIWLLLFLRLNNKKRNYVIDDCDFFFFKKND